MAETHPPLGRFVWHELITTDPDAAIDFYEKVIGWGMRPFHPGYRLWTAGDTPMGGVMALPEDARREGTPPRWLMYVAVPDADEATERAAGMGAKIHKAPDEPGWIDIPDVGPFAVLSDPQGATFALYQPTMPGAGSDEAPEGDFSWHELATDNWQAAWDFYSRLFGWEHASSFEMGPMGTYFMFKRSGGTRTLGGMFNKPPDMPFPPHWLCYVRVADADRAGEIAVEHGGKLLNGPMDVPGGDRIAQLMDPQGVMFAVHALSEDVRRAARAPEKRAAKKAPKKAAAKKSPKKAAAKAARKTAGKRAVMAAKKKAAKAPQKAAGKKKARKPARKKPSRKPAARKKTAKKRR